MLRVVIEVGAPTGMAQAVKEHLAMVLERFGDTHVVEVKEIEYEQKGFFR